MNTSDVACAHLANDVDQRHATSAKAYTHQPWRVPIGWATYSLACEHRPNLAHINRGMCVLANESVVECVLQLGDIICGLRA